MNSLFAMRVFCAIVQARSFSAAAERLETTHSTVSRQLQLLETELGVRLLNRNTRSLSLTTAGEQYYAASIDILERVDAAAQAVAAQPLLPSGLLRVSLPMAIGTLELASWLPGFQRAYPDIQLELSCEDRFVDLVSEGFDVALRISGPLPDTSLVARTLAVSERVLVASPDYLLRCGLPRDAEQLIDHRLLAHSGAGDNGEWLLSPREGPAQRIRPKGALSINAITALHEAALAGCGIGAFIEATVRAELASGKLVRVLPNYNLGIRHYYALYPTARQMPSRARAFIDFMVEHYRPAEP